MSERESMSAEAVVHIARCSEHGLHGSREACFVCGGPVEQVAMIPASLAEFWEGRYDQQHRTLHSVEDALATVREELKRVQCKCYQLRQQVKTMHVAFDKSETAKIRAERDEYRKVLSNIAYHLDQGDELDPVVLRLKLRIALECKARSASRRKRIVRRFKREAGLL